MLHEFDPFGFDPDVDFSWADGLESSAALDDVDAMGFENSLPEGWQPPVQPDLVDDDEVIDLQLADDDDEDQSPRTGLNAAGMAVSVLLHLWVLVNLSGLFVTRSEADLLTETIETEFFETEVPDEPEEVVEYELSNPDDRELEVREVVNATSVGVVQSEQRQVASAPTPLTEIPPTELRSTTYDIPEGAELDDRVVVRGSVGEAIVELESALDLVTWEIVNNLQERKVLVVWLLDASSSLTGQRTVVRKRLKRIYGELDALEEVGQIPSGGQPLVTAVVSFGQNTNFLTPTPTIHFAKIDEAFGAVKTDASGKENVFTAVGQVMQKFDVYRIKHHRRIIIITITDEAGDDFGPPLETAIVRCRKFGAKAYVIGPSAPFGIREGHVPYVAPENGRTYQLPVDLGPESAIVDHVQLPFWFSGPQYRSPPLSSGFPPYALARLVQETGGMYFMTNMTTMVGLAPLGDYDASVLRPFEPDYSYSSVQDCLDDVRQHPIRMAVWQAAVASRKYQAEGTPRLDIRVTPGNFKQVASQAQQTVAKSQLMIDTILQAFPPGIEREYDREPSLRWRMAFALAYGRLLAQKTRCLEYNYALAGLKNDLTPQDVGSRSNHWLFRPDGTINHAGGVKRMARTATELLTRVVEEAPGTPFAVMARRELKDPLGIRVVQRFIPPVQRRPARPSAAPPRPRQRVQFVRPKPKTGPPPKPKPKPKPPRLPRL